MCAGTQASLYGPNGPLHLADAAVGRYNIEGGEAQQFSDAAEFVVTVHVTDGEPTGLIHTDDPSQTLYDRLFVPVGDRVRGAVTNAAGDCVKKREPLYKEKINTQGDAAVMVKDGSGDMLRSERLCTRRRRGVCGVAFEHSDVGATDEECLLCVGRGNETAPNGVALEYADKLGFCRSSNFPIQVTCLIAGQHFPGREKFLLCNAVISIVTFVSIEPDGCSTNFITAPSSRWTCSAGSVEVSILTRRTF